MKKIFLHLFCLLFLITPSCSIVDCESGAEFFRNNYSFWFVIESKSIQYEKENVFEGPSIDNSNVKQKFIHPKMQDLYEIAEMGDTLWKKRGKATVELHKRDTIHLYYYICGDKAYK